MNIAEPRVENVSGRSDRAILEIDGNIVDGVSFLSRVAARQNKLAENGISAGDRVLVPNNRGGDFWIDMLAVWCQGAANDVDSLLRQGSGCRSFLTGKTRADESGLPIKPIKPKSIYLTIYLFKSFKKSPFFVEWQRF